MPALPAAGPGAAATALTVWLRADLAAFDEEGCALPFLLALIELDGGARCREGGLERLGGRMAPDELLGSVAMGIVGCSRAGSAAGGSRDGSGEGMKAGGCCSGSGAGSGVGEGSGTGDGVCVGRGEGEGSGTGDGDCCGPGQQ